MRHYWLTCDAPDLPGNAFRRALGRNRPETLEGGKGGGSAPSYPDPNVVSSAQTASNEATANYNKYLNLNNYSNPLGSQTTYQTGTGPNGVPIFTTQVNAIPQVQSQLAGLLNQTGNSGNVNATALNGLYGLGAQYQGLNSAIGALGSTLSPGAAQNAQQQGQQAAYSSSMGYLTPQFQQQQESTDAQLANQGITPGSEAWNNAEGNLSRNQTFQQQQALDSSQLTGSQIGSQNWQNQLEGIQSQAGLFGLAGQNLGAQSGLYGQEVGIGQTPYSNLQTIAQMIPGYSGTGQAAAGQADVESQYNNQYQSQLANYNANQASSNATTGAIGTVLGMGAAIAF